MVAVATKRTRLSPSSASPTFTVERTSSRSASRTAAASMPDEGSATTSPRCEKASPA